jgi:amino acid adenylation domain-containing protein/non-ribosomal peptide synthase protein (TIGR01720 family)
MQHHTLIEVLRDKRGRTDRGITFIEGGAREEFLSYAGLYESALQALGLLQQEAIHAGDELVFQVEDNRSFVILFWACILGGIIPVPLSIGRNEGHKEKLFSVWQALENPRLLIADHDLARLGEFAAGRQSDELWAAIRSRTIDLSAALACRDRGEIYAAEEGDIAFVQFSSGSTGQPKGVVLTHGNLITNMQGISKAAGYVPGESMLSWMPLSHDMGLIGFHLNPLFNGLDHYLMPTPLFVRRPGLWLAKATHHRVNILCSPNFGYEYVLKHCLDGSSRQDWELSAVRLIYNGAEPISERLCRDFSRRLAPYGLRRNAVCPVYGLAEASLAVTISDPEADVIALQIDRRRAGLGDRVVPGDPQDFPLSFVNVGKAVDDCSVRIADEADKPVQAGIIGSVQIKGKNVSSGYYGNQDETRKILTSDGWLRTGDLGFMQEGGLYITGRIKDILFVNGQNYYPQDIEQIAEGPDGIALNRIAVCGFFNPVSQREETAALVLHRGDIEGFIPLAESLQARVSSRTGVWIDRILPVREMPRTSSGKLQRFRLVEQLRNGEFEAVEQVMRQRLHDRSGIGHVQVPQIPDEERKLLRIWQRILDKETIGITQSFFEVGGNSLKTAEMLMEVQRVFGVLLSPEAVYAAGTIRQLAAEIVERKGQGREMDGGGYRPIPAGVPARSYPLSKAQQPICYAWERDRSSLAYNLPVIWKLEGDIDSGKLESCIRQMAVRHDSWRMRFYDLGGPRLEVRDSVKFTLPIHECASGNEAALLLSILKPFDLSKDLLFRMELIKTGPETGLLFTDFHHIISDGISHYYFMRELWALYSGEEADSAPIQYRDYITWEKEELATGRIRLQEAYWRDQLRDGWPVLEMPIDYERPAFFTSRGGKIPGSVDRATIQTLKAIARENNCTLHAVLLTAYSILLSRYSSQEEMVIGIPAGRRKHADLRTVQGMFVNSLPIRCRVNGEENFLQILQAHASTIETALDNQEYPVAELISSLGHRRDPSRHPLFDTMFTYQNMGLPRARNAGLSISRYFFDPGCAKFDISIEFFEEDGPMPYTIEYSTALFKPATIREFSACFDRLLTSIGTDPWIPAGRHAIISPEEYDFRIRKFNDTSRDYCPVETVDQQFRRQAALKPDHPAIRSGLEIMTYRKLNEASDELALVLRARGVGKDRLTGIHLRRSPELILAILGILKAGGCYLPLAADLPVERIKFLLLDSRCRLLLTDQGRIGAKWLQELPEVEVLDLCAGRAGAVKHESAASGQLTADALSEHCYRFGDLAYVMYTSGTTGKPKGVMVEHGSLMNYIAWAGESYGGGQGKLNFPLFTSISFDLTVTSIFLPLVTGNTITIYEEDEDEPTIQKIFADGVVDIVKLTPSHLRLLLAARSPVTRSGSRISRLIVGGERLDTGLATEISELLGDQVEIFNEYGPTEATVGCMIHRYEEGKGRPGVPIGVPAANTRIYILDKCLNPVPAGVIGELHIAGRGLARGYLFNEDLTRGKFIPDPFVEGEKMYRTGDMARYLCCGGIVEYIGRYDQQVKLNGYRVELQEIERLLTGRPGIGAAVVVMRGNEKGGGKLYAYYTRQERSPEDYPEQSPEDSWKEYLSAMLPQYMVPHRFILLEKLPITRNGKIDYAALPDPPARRVPDKETERNEIGQEFLEVWREVLGESDLTPGDNFYELGGDSIKAVQIASRLHEKGISIKVKDILMHSSIRQSWRHAVLTGARKGYDQGLLEGRAGLTAAGAWFFRLALQDPGHFNQSILLKLRGRPDKGLLQEVLRHLIAHHDSLRMNFDPAEGRLFYNSTHLSGLPVIEELPMDPIILEEWKGRCDITQSPLFRAALVHPTQSGGEGGASLLLTAHHLVIDGISWRILLEDLHTIWEALQNGRPPRLPGKTASLTAWEEEVRFLAGEWQREEAYWKRLESQSFILPRDFDTGDWRERHVHKVKGKLNNERTALLLKGSSATYHSDVRSILLAALLYSLREWTNLDNFIIELENHGRHLESIDVSRTSGWFTVMHPLQLEWTEESVANRIRGLREKLRNVPHNGIGYFAAKYLMSESKSGSSGMTEIRFNYLGQFGAELDNELFAYSDCYTGSDIGKANLMTSRLAYNIVIIRGELQVEIGYNACEFHEAGICRLRDLYLQGLINILDEIKSTEDADSWSAEPETSGLNEEEFKELFN